MDDLSLTIGFIVYSILQVIMATNRADTLDPALLRPGRLDRKIEFPMPDRRQKRLVCKICYYFLFLVQSNPQYWPSNTYVPTNIVPPLFPPFLFKYCKTPEYRAILLCPERHGIEGGGGGGFTVIGLVTLSSWLMGQKIY